MPNESTRPISKGFILAFCVIFAVIGFGVGFAFFRSEEIMASVGSVFINLILFCIITILLMPIESKIHSGVFVLSVSAGAMFAAYAKPDMKISILLLGIIVSFIEISAYGIARNFRSTINRFYDVE